MPRPFELQAHRASQTSVAWKVQDDTARAMEELAVEYDGHERGEFGPAPVALDTLETAIRVTAVEVSVQEGRLVEAPTSAATGTHRCAYGEFVGPLGELASYAFGWATDADPRVGRMTIGIGAGNPGGGSFHAIVDPRGEGHAFSLVDEPFARVPQGGPDLTAAQARSHDDLPFVWWVADHVMERDRRAWWMRHWLVGTPAIQTAEVFDHKEPVLLVVNDAEDDLWQLIGSSDPGPDGKIGHLYHAVDADPTLIDILDLDPGYSAIRDRVGASWTRDIHEPEP